MSKEAMKLALEALESSQQYVEASANAKMKAGWGDQLDVADAAITALREALAEQPAPAQGWKLVPYALTPEMSHIVETEMEGRDFADFWRDLLNAAPQPAQQEPVGWMCEDYDKHGTLQSKCIAMNQQRADPDNPLRVVKPLVFANSSPPAQPTPPQIDPEHLLALMQTARLEMDKVLDFFKSGPTEKKQKRSGS